MVIVPLTAVSAEFWQEENAGAPDTVASILMFLRIPKLSSARELTAREQFLLKREGPFFVGILKLAVHSAERDPEVRGIEMVLV
jgi:hypothetical protein